MNDFLSSLVSKSLGVGPMIGPRPVSLFEPWRVGGALETAPALDRAEPDRSLSQFENDTAARIERPRREPYAPGDEAPRAPVMLPTGLMPAPVLSQPREHAASDELAATAPLDRSSTSAAESAHVSPSAVSVVERIERVIVDRTQSDHDHVEPDHPAQERGPRSRGVELIANDAVAHASSNKVPLVERIEREIVDRDHASREPVEIRRAAPAIVEHLPFQRVNGEPERSDQAQARPPGVIQSMSTTPAPGVPDVHRITPSRVTPIVERIERIRENSAQDQSDRLNAAQARPATIQVTIGRIEVRATPPPAAPARRASPAAPAMSLEEYLRSRSGERR